MKKDKFIPWMRTFPHSNSGRKIADRYEDDRDEAAEYTDTPLKNRNGGIHSGAYPDTWEDDFIYQKYESKPKGSRHRDRDSIRKKDAEDFDC